MSFSALPWRRPATSTSTSVDDDAEHGFSVSNCFLARELRFGHVYEACVHVQQCLGGLGTPLIPPLSRHVPMRLIARISCSFVQWHVYWVYVLLESLVVFGREHVVINNRGSVMLST